MKSFLTQKITFTKVDSRKKINKMSDSEGFDENSYESYDTENDILEELADKFNCLKPYQFEPEKELVKDTDESEE